MTGSSLSIMDNDGGDDDDEEEEEEAAVFLYCMLCDGQLTFGYG